MIKKGKYSFKEHLKESLQDLEFQKAWRATEVEQKLAKQIIEARIKKDLSQRDLARKVQTTQAVICRIETMNSNPSLSLLKRIAKALDTQLVLHVG